MLRFDTSANRPNRLIHPMSSSLSSSFFNAISQFCTLSLILAVIFCMLATEQYQAHADSDVTGWFEREIRAPKPKFIRFGRAGQKLIRFGRSSPTETRFSDGNSQLEALVDAVDELYPYSPELIRAYQPVPKRAQKLIRFG